MNMVWYKKFSKKLNQLVLMGILTSNSGLGADLYQPEVLKITWKLKEEKKSASNEDLKIWQKSCSMLGNALTVGKGPWGTGVFSSYACFIGDKKISGTGGTSNFQWVLTYSEQDNGSDLILTKLATNNHQWSKISFARSDYTKQFFHDPAFTDLVALRMMSGLPVLGYITYDKLRSSKSFFERSVWVPPTGFRQYKSAPPPEQLLLFEAKSNGVYLIPQVAGGVKRQSYLEAPLLEKNQKNVTTNSAKKWGVTWSVEENVTVPSGTGGFWFHDARGIKVVSAELDAVIKDASVQLDEVIGGGMFSRFLKGVKATTSSGFVGIRYGAQLLPQDPLLKKTAFLGVVTEIRGGPAEGVRYYYDKLFKKTATIDDQETSIEWSRHILGKSFGLQLNRFVDRIDLTPKIGVWNFNAHLIDQYDVDGKAVSTGAFKITNGLSLSFEVGVEWQSSWYTIRPWYSYDYANALNSVTKKKVTSNRLGLDTSWTAGPRFSLLRVPFRTALLGFFMVESIELSSSDTDPTLQEGEREIVGVVLNSAYAGLGLALSW